MDRLISYAMIRSRLYIRKCTLLFRKATNLVYLFSHDADDDFGLRKKKVKPKTDENKNFTINIEKNYMGLFKV